MNEHSSAFYDALAEKQHLIFKDWNTSIDWQASIIGPLLERELPNGKLRLLDCACGIGTQALGLARRGHLVVAADLSAAAVARARREASQRDLSITFHVADMGDLAGVPETGFDAVVAVDNALPHLSTEHLAQAGAAVASKLRPGGVFLASIRDYDQLLLDRPTVLPPMFYSDAGKQRFTHQVWNWIDERNYVFHLYITRETDRGWASDHFVSRYRALRRGELTEILSKAAFRDVRWLLPAETAFYQPIVIARRPAAGDAG